MAPGGVSLNPSDFKEGGGLVDNVDATITEAKFTLFDYQGKANAVPAAYFKLKDDADNEYEQYWSMGSAKDWIPNQEGTELVKVGNSDQINAGSNGAIMLASIINAGFPADKIGVSIKVFEGMYAHWSRVAAPKRSIAKAPRADGRTFDDTILTVDKIHRLPWEKGKGAAKPAAKPAAPAAAKGKAAPAPAAAAAEEANGGGDLNDEATNVVLGILTQAGGPVQRQQLATKVFAALKAHPQRNDIVQLVYRDDFLKNGPWTYENGSLNLG